VFLFDFDGDLYGQTVDVAFIGWIRAEQKFDGIEPLKRQMANDVSQAKNSLKRAGKSAFPNLGEI
jgi:riboflavin kinase/FMN adenylyltransferase